MTFGPIVKDPNATIYLTEVWGTTYLGTDTIGSANWSSTPTGLTLGSGTVGGGTAATIPVSGGTVGEIYHVTCRMYSVGGVIDDRSVIVRCEEA